VPGLFRCYSDQTCKKVQLGGIPFVNFGSCPAGNVTFDAVNCECRPDVYTTCGACAQAAHASCVWLEKEYQGQWSFVLNAGGQSIAKELEPTVFEKGRCWSGNGFFGPLGTVTNTSFRTSALSASAQYTITPTNGWYWGQCVVPKAYMAGFTLLLTMGLAVCAVCLCRRLFQRRRTRRDA